MDTRTGDSSEEEISRPMMVDLTHNSTNILVPSSQPDDDDQVTFAPATATEIPAARINDS